MKDEDGLMSEASNRLRRSLFSLSVSDNNKLF